jgi:hypothetical protein
MTGESKQTIRIMEETIEILSEKVLNSISNWTLIEQSVILREIAERLNEMAVNCMMNEFGLRLNDE